MITSQKEWLKKRYAWIQKNIPPGIRTVLGLLLIVGGLLGFLPIVGFWMIPLGLAFIAIDLTGLYRLFRRSNPKEKQK